MFCLIFLSFLTASVLEIGSTSASDITKNSTAQFPYVKLSTGALMPAIGYGTWQVRGELCTTAVEWSLDIGYRSIDTAENYGNEPEIGIAIQRQILAGKIKRKDIFVTTKFFPTHVNRSEDVTTLLKKSLTRLNLDYVDLYLQHKPQKKGYASNLEMWKGLEDVYRQGLTKAIGVSTFSVQELQQLFDNSEVKPHNVQNENNLYHPDAEALEFCKRNNISYTSWSPLSNPSWLSNHGTPNPMKNAVVKEIGEKYHKSPAQVLLRHLFQRGIVLIPKSTHRERILENFSVFDFNLTDEEMTKLNAEADKH